MKTPAIIASLTVAGSIAFAAGQQSGGRQSPPMPSGAQAHSMQEEMPQARMAQMALVADCPQGSDKDWFTIAHPLPSCQTGCIYPLTFGASACDINGDGSLEYVEQDCRHSNYQQVLSNNEPVNGCFANVSEVSGSGDNCSLSFSCVASRQAIGSLAKAMVPEASNAIASFGFRDMDADGDLDMLLFMYLDNSLGSYRRNAWLENTGYEKPAPPVAADLNQDGQVDGADLGLLLVAWGSNP